MEGEVFPKVEGLSIARFSTLPVTVFSPASALVGAVVVRAFLGHWSPDVLPPDFCDTPPAESSGFEPSYFTLLASSFAALTSTLGSSLAFGLGVGTRRPIGTIGTAGVTGPGVAGVGFCWF
jgi:hypothetical protein